MSAEGEEPGSASYDARCIFCKISNDQENDSELLHSDEELACFKDIRPGAPYHYLVVPKKHVGNCKTLTSDHVQLVQNMVEVGKNMLKKNNVTDLEDISVCTPKDPDKAPALYTENDFQLLADLSDCYMLGFHWPPFCSISHLHLHVLAPASQLGFLSRLIYRLNSYWFITADQLIERLQTNVPAS